MQVVIDIPEKLYEKCKRIGDVQDILFESIRNGIVLPKGHGRLVDENDLSLMTVHMIDGVFVCNAPTIIEADKESEDRK